MKLYNSLTQKTQNLNQKTLNVYACGPTVYNYIHLGNARPIFLVDTLIRYWNYQGIKVNFLENITDIDDKIIDKALSEKKSEADLSAFYTAAYLADLKALNIQMPTKLEPISQQIPGMIGFIEQLIKQGDAYAVNGDVYFSIAKWMKEYGQLAGKKITELISGQRVEINVQKQNPLDFVLWKKTPTGKKWDSPFGAGRPGWHTECAFLIDHYFQRKTIDLHFGGVDLKFPHHENERIQFLAKNHREITQLWIHNGHLNFENEKMSKSLGNVVLVKDFLQQYPPDLLRWMFLTTNYKQPLNFSADLIDQGLKFFEKLNNLKKKLIQTTLLDVPNSSKTKEKIQKLPLLADFKKAMDDDVNTAEVLALIELGIKTLNQGLNEKNSFAQLKPVYQQLVQILTILGFSPLLDLTISAVDEKLYRQWTAALKKQDYQQADQFRKQLQKKGLV